MKKDDWCYEIFMGKYFSLVGYQKLIVFQWCGVPQYLKKGNVR